MKFKSCTDTLFYCDAFCFLLFTSDFFLSFLSLHSTTHGLGLLLPPTPDFHSPAINRKWCLKVSITDIGALSALPTSFPLPLSPLFSLFFSCKPSLTLSTCGLWINSRECSSCMMDKIFSQVDGSVKWACKHGITLTTVLCFSSGFALPYWTRSKK